MEEKIEIAPELAQLLEAKEYEAAKNFIYKHFKSDKPHRNIEFLQDKLPKHIDTNVTLEIRNHKKSSIKGLAFIYSLTILLPIMMYINNGNIGPFIILSPLLILLTIPYVKHAFDNSIKMRITPTHLEFYKKGILEKKVSIDNILTGYAHIRHSRSRSRREYYYLSLFFKDATEPFQRSVLALEYTSEELGAIIYEYMSKK